MTEKVASRFIVTFSGFCCLILVCIGSVTRSANAFLVKSTARNNDIFGVAERNPSRSSSIIPRIIATERSNIERRATCLDDDGINILFDDNKDGGLNPCIDASRQAGRGRTRWENLKPSIKKRLVKKGQEKAIANKRKREPAADKKRRMMMKFKELQREKKRSSRVKRPLGFDERAPLSNFSSGMEVSGTVISLTKYGAYVDCGTECDGLLHISQITRDFFVEHPRQVLTPGDEITVRIRSTSPELKKMQLTMLDEENADITKSRHNQEDDDEVNLGTINQGASLEEFEIYDELWGEMKRVTDFGSYIDVGAEVDAFLHFMDHPLWEDGMVPSEFMEKGERVRVWVADVDTDMKRIRITGCRPDIPGPK